MRCWGSEQVGSESRDDHDAKDGGYLHENELAAPVHLLCAMSELSVEVAYVQSGRLPGLFQHGAVYLEKDALDLAFGQDGSGPGEDVSGKVARAHDVVRHVRLELRLSSENDHGKELVFPDLQQGFEFLDVFVVLSEGVLERVLALAESLGPFGVVRVSENPAAHVLGFDDEDAVFRNNDVVDLRCAV